MIICSWPWEGGDCHQAKHHIAVARTSQMDNETIIEKPKGSAGEDYTLIDKMQLQDEKPAYLAMMEFGTRRSA